MEKVYLIMVNQCIIPRKVPPAWQIASLHYCHPQTLEHRELQQGSRSEGSSCCARGVPECLCSVMLYNMNTFFCELLEKA